MSKNQILFIFLLLSAGIFAQTLNKKYFEYGRTFRYELGTAPFPDSIRAEGYTYNGQYFSAKEHYSDSSVAVFVPSGFKAGNETDIVVYFHGWNNNIDSALIEFNLIEQFAAANKNALFIFPEGAKNAPDSYGGKLEGKGAFKLFIEELFTRLVKDNVIKTKKIGKIILAGHSGGYHVIAFIVLHGGLTNKIKEIYLFDGLYGKMTKYIYWIENSDGRFIDIFTENGGTKMNSENFMTELGGKNIPYFYTNESNLKMDDLRNHRIIFIYSDLSHNQVVSKREQFKKFLSSSCLNEIK